MKNANTTKSSTIGSLLGLIVYISILSSCESPEEKLLNKCLEGLEEKLEMWAKYDGWSTSRAEIALTSMQPDIIRNEQYSSEAFFLFEVEISNFTVKNTFNSDVKSHSLCSGFITKTSDGKIRPSASSFSHTLNGERLGYY